MLTSLLINKELTLATRLPVIDKLKPCVKTTQGFNVNDRIKRIEFMLGVR